MIGRSDSSDDSRRFIWLASYPKSGNTWLRLALASLRAKGKALDINDFRDRREAIASSTQFFERFIHVDASDLPPAERLEARADMVRQVARAFREPLIWKAHDAFQLTAEGEWLFPPELTVASIYVVRDPRDVALSYAAHMGTDVDTLIDWMNDPDAVIAAYKRSFAYQLPQPVGTWSSHVATWLDEAQPRPLLVRYEDMIMDIRAVLTRIAEHLSWSVDSQSVEGAAAATAFRRLQDAEIASGFRERPKASQRFFRRGIAGGWRDSLAAEQIRRVERDHGAMMTRLGYL